MVLLWSKILSLGQKHSWNLGKKLSLGQEHFVDDTSSATTSESWTNATCGAACGNLYSVEPMVISQFCKATKMTKVENLYVVALEGACWSIMPAQPTTSVFYFSFTFPVCTMLNHGERPRPLPMSLPLSMISYSGLLPLVIVDCRHRQ